MLIYLFINQIPIEEKQKHHLRLIFKIFESHIRKLTIYILKKYFKMVNKPIMYTMKMRRLIF